MGTLANVRHKSGHELVQGESLLCVGPGYVMFLEKLNQHDHHDVVVLIQRTVQYAFQASASCNPIFIPFSSSQ
jgi:hypothetical protein